MEEIDISLLNISVNDAIQFVKNCKALKKLCFKVDDNVDFDRLNERLGVKWRAMSTKSNESEKMYDINGSTTNLKTAIIVRCNASQKLLQNLNDDAFHRFQ